jgi:hypothetical protein
VRAGPSTVWRILLRAMLKPYTRMTFGRRVLSRSQTRSHIWLIDAAIYPQWRDDPLSGPFPAMKAASCSNMAATSLSISISSASELAQASARSRAAWSRYS